MTIATGVLSMATPLLDRSEPTRYELVYERGEV